MSKLASFFRLPPFSMLEKRRGVLLPLARLYCDNWFDLLGSGWIRIVHGMQALGIEGHIFPGEKPLRPDIEGEWLRTRLPAKSFEQAKAAWQLIDPEYIPVDWHIYYNSGYRIPEATPIDEIEIFGPEGTDIKEPWELARMQHFPQLAFAYALHKDKNDSKEANRCLCTFRHHILDFIATNPCGFGVNWMCAMDVGIRAANWLIAYDLFRAGGAELDSAFLNCLKNSLLQHGRHLKSHLEYVPDESTKGCRNNHYYSDLVGLLFIAAYLPRSKETKGWLDFAAKELLVESLRQFHEEGTNFEGSTSYHRLSGELLLYSTVLLRELGYEIPATVYQRLYRAAVFSKRITAPDGNVIQIGDNDSGRLFKLDPVMERLTVAEARKRYRNLEDYHALPDKDTYWFENHLDHRSWVGGINAMFDDSALALFVGEALIEAHVIPPQNKRNSRKVSDIQTKIECTENTLPLIGKAQWQTEWISVGETNLCKDMKCYTYPKFGIYLWRSDRIFLSIRCGKRGQQGIGGHDHNDQLSIVLYIDGKAVLTDPGTYLYSPITERRNQFRSIQTHNGPRSAIGKEPGDLTTGLFCLPTPSGAKVHCFGVEGFLGEHTGYGVPVWRQVEFQADRIRIIDGGACPLCQPRQAIEFSPGYGWLSRQEFCAENQWKACIL